MHVSSNGKSSIPVVCTEQHQDLSLAYRQQVVNSNHTIGAEISKGHLFLQLLSIS